jgi:hypothetical protein
MQEDHTCWVTVLLGDAQAHAGRLSRTSQCCSLGDSLARPPVESLTHWNGMHGGEFCVAIAAECQCVLEGGLRRPREIDGAEDASGSGHSDLLQKDGRRGANLFRLLRAAMARTDGRLAIKWHRRLTCPMGTSASPTLCRGKMGTINAGV